MKSFIIDEGQLARLERIRNLLFNETRRISSDERRDAAQAIDAILRVIQQLEIPEKEKS